MAFKIIFPLFLILLTSCYSIPDLVDFDKDSWNENSCEAPRYLQQELIINQKEKLLTEGQAEIKTLFGQPDEHELYNRNQKFFYYDLRKSDCDTTEKLKRLSIRFDALDRVKEVLIIE